MDGNSFQEPALANSLRSDYTSVIYREPHTSQVSYCRPISTDWQDQRAMVG